MKSTNNTPVNNTAKLSDRLNETLGNGVNYDDIVAVIDELEKNSGGSVQEDIIVVSSQEATGVAYDDDVKFALSPDAGYDPSSYVGKTAVLTMTYAEDTYTSEGVVKSDQRGPYFNFGEDGGIVEFGTNGVVVIFAEAAGSPFEDKPITFELKVSGSDGGGQNDFVVVDVNYDGSTFTSNYTYEQVRGLVDSGAKMAVRSGGAFFDYYGHTSSTVMFGRINVYGNVFENRVIKFKNDDTITVEFTKYDLTSLLVVS